MATHSEDYHKMLGILMFTLPYFKPLGVEDAVTEVPGLVFYTPDVKYYLTGVEYDYFSDAYATDDRSLAIQVATFIGNGGVIYQHIAPDYIRVEGDPAVSLKSVSSFIIKKRVLPYQETQSEDEIKGAVIGEDPPPLLRSAICDYNYVADANIVMDQGANEEWMNRIRVSEVGGPFIANIYSIYPEYGTYYYKWGFKNCHSAGFEGYGDSDSALCSHFYKAESSFLTVPAELYNVNYYMNWRWRNHRPELLDKFGLPSHYSLAYQFNQKGSYYRQGLDGSMYYPTNMDPAEYSKYSDALHDGGNANRTEYSSVSDFTGHLSPENFYNINLKRTLYKSSGFQVASPIMGLGINLTGSVDYSSSFKFYKYNIFCQALYHQAFMTGGRLGLYANFSDMFKTFEERDPPVDPQDFHTVYEGEFGYVSDYKSSRGRDPDPLPSRMEKSIEYYERYQLGGGNAMTMALAGWAEWSQERMLNWPHDGYIPSLAFDIKGCINARSVLTYPITDEDQDADGVVDEFVDGEEDESSIISTSLLTESQLQDTFVYDLQVDVSEGAVDLELNETIESEYFKAINFFPVSMSQGIANLPEKDSSVLMPDIKSYFGNSSELAYKSEPLESYVYWALVDGPVMIPPSEETLENTPDAEPQTRKILIAYGSDLAINMFDHAKICNRCYNMVRTVACTASTLPAPLQSNANGSADGRSLTSSIFAASYTNSNFCHSGVAPPEPRNFYLDTLIHSTEGGNEGGFLNSPIIVREPGGSGNWPTDFWNSNFPFLDEDTRHVTSARKWGSKTAIGNKSVWSDQGHVRSIIFDYAWNLSLDNVAQSDATRGMNIPQESIQIDGFVDMVGNVPVSSLNRRVCEGGAVHGGVYIDTRSSYTNIFDRSSGSQFSPMMGASLGGLMATVGSMGMGSSMYVRTHTTLNKAESIRSIVHPVTYNPTQAEVGIAVGSGCSNISIYKSGGDISSEFEKPEVIYRYYGYGCSPHYVGLHAKGFLWIPTDIGFYVDDDNTIPSLNNREERMHEWGHPLIRNGAVADNIAPVYPTLVGRHTMHEKITPKNWSNGTHVHEYEADDVLVFYPHYDVLPTVATSWQSIPRVKQSDIYRDSVFTVLGTYGQVTNGDSSYWQYVEVFIDRDITNASDLDSFNFDG